MNQKMPPNSDRHVVRSIGKVSIDSEKMSQHQSPIVTTRTQLQGYGLTRYQATKITKLLTPTSRQGRTYNYLVTETIGSIRTDLSSPLLKLINRQRLVVVLEILLERLSNIIPLVAGSDATSHPALGRLTQQLMNAISVTDKSLVDLKATAANINGKYKK
jgi:hypothetical protein